MSVSKKVRFEVFKRDKFTCQYCGRSAPDVLLQADHIAPKSKGGKDDIINLITSCQPCNIGKGATPLSDETALVKQRNQLEALEERQQQLRMMLKWQQSLLELDNEATDGLAGMWQETSGTDVTDTGKRDLRKLVREFGVNHVADAIRIAGDRYFVFLNNGKVDLTSAAWAFKKIGGICYNRRNEAKAA